MRETPIPYVSCVRCMKLTMIVNDPPYGSEKPWNAMRLASTASKETGMKVQAFLMGDSVSAAKRGQRTPEGYYSMEKMIAALVQRGGGGEGLRRLH